MGDGHRARSPVHDTLAHRSEEESAESTATASAHNHEAGVLARPDQGFDREPPQAVLANGDVGVLLQPARERLGNEDLFPVREGRPVDGPYG